MLSRSMISMIGTSLSSVPPWINWEMCIRRLQPPIEPTTITPRTQMRRRTRKRRRMYFVLQEKVVE
jgi:hypothetical protein